VDPGYVMPGSAGSTWNGERERPRPVCVAMPRSRFLVRLGRARLAIGTAVLATSLLAACSAAPPVGPLGQERDVASGWATSLTVGDRFADGDPLLRIPKDVSGVVLLDVEPLLDGDGLRPLGVQMALPDRPMAAVQMVDSWPPVDPDVPELVDAIGAVLDGDASWGGFGFNRGYELFVGFEVISPTRTTVQGYRVTYEHGGETYSLVLPFALAVCGHEGPPPSGADREFERTIQFDHG
jgi:hypothetical protein